MTLNIQKGHKVRLRNGDVQTIADVISGHALYPIRGVGHLNVWARDGRYYKDRTDPHPKDIVEVLSDPEPILHPMVTVTIRIPANKYKDIEQYVVAQPEGR